MRPSRTGRARRPRGSSRSRTSGRRRRPSSTQPTGSPTTPPGRCASRSTATTERSTSNATSSTSRRARWRRSLRPTRTSPGSTTSGSSRTWSGARPCLRPERARAAVTAADNLRVRAVGRLPARVHTKLLVAFVGPGLLVVVVAVLGLRLLGESNDRVVSLGGLQERAAAYGTLRSDARHVRQLLAGTLGRDYCKVLAG